jgi:hypothetical protein
MNSVTVKISLVALSLLGGLCLSASPAQALPASGRAGGAQSAPIVDKVGWGCGPYGCGGGWGGYGPGYGYPRPHYWGGGYGWRPRPWGGQGWGGHGWRGHGWGGGYGPRTRW